MARQPLHRRGESRLAHRLHEVVERLILERLDRELIEGGEEDDRGHAVGRAAANHLEAVDAGHLHVEEDDVWREPIERREHFVAVPAFTDDRELGKRGQHLPHASASRGLVVGDERTPLSANHGRTPR